MSVARWPGLGPFITVVLFILAGCATQPPYCKLVPLATMPLHVRHKLLLVTAHINGHPVPLVVDTGAERTTLTQAAVAQLHLARDGRITRSAGIGGFSASLDAKVPGIWLGDTDFPVHSVAVGDFALPLFGGKADGLLGADILLAFDLDLDTPARRLTLYRVRTCPTALPPFPSVEVSGVGARRDRMLVPITVNGVHGRAVLDTGSQTSAISLEMAEHAGVTPAMLAHDPTILLHGASPNPLRVPVQRFRSMTIGGSPVLYPRLAVVPEAVGLGDGLVGDDFIRGRRLWLAFPTHQLFIAESRLP